MAYASKTIVINRPKKEVFDFLANGLNNPKWRSSVIDISLAEGSQSQLGAVYKQGSKGPFGRRIDADYKIVELEPNAKIVFQVITGPARPTGKFLLADSGTNTELTFALNFEPKGFAKLLGPMVQKTMDMEVQNLENLKSFLEK